MKKKIYAIIILLLIGLMTSSCAVFDNLFGGQQPIDVEVTVGEPKYSNFSMIGAIVSYDLTIKNKNSSKLEITGYDYELKFKDNFKYSDKKEKTTIKNISGNATEIVTISKELNFIEMAKKITDFKDLSSLSAILDGKLYVKSKTDGMNAPFSSTKELPIAKLPKIEAGKVGVKLSEYTFVVLTFEVIINNPNSFDVSYTPSYSVKIESNEVAKVSNDKPIVAAANSKTTGIIERQINLTSLSSSLLTGKSINATLDGKLQYETFLGSIEEPIKIYGGFTPPLLPKISIDNLSIKTTTLPPTAIINLILKIENKNTFNIEILSWDFSIKLNDNSLVSSYKADPITIDANSTKKITLPITIDPSILVSTGIAGDFAVSINFVLKSLTGGNDISVNYKLNYPPF